MNSVAKPGYKETPIGSVPSEWSVKQVAMLADVDSESLPKKTPADFLFRYISLGDVDSGKLLSGHDQITYSESPSRARRVVRTGDVLFATVRPNLKGHYFVRQAHGNVIASTGFAVVRAKAGIASPEFLYQSLLSKSVDTQIEKLTVGSSYPAVNSADVKGLLLSVPPLAEQKKIAAILKAVDEKLDIISRQIEATQTLKRGLMQTLFRRGVGNQNTDGRWVPHTDFKDSDLGEIPKAWCTRPIGTLFDVVERPFDMSEDKLYRRVTVKRRYGGIELRDELPGKDIKVKNQFLVKEGDFLISERQIVHGACGIVPAELAGALVSNEYLVLKAKDGIDVRYFGYLVQLLRYAKYFLLCSQGVDIEKFLFKPKDWLKKLIPVPPHEEQVRIADMLSTIEEKLQSFQRRQSVFQQLKCGLMQKLLTGEWRVKLDEEAVTA